MIQDKNLQFVRIGLASPELIRSWAERQLPNGELIGQITKPYTIHYQTQKPEKDGLFCERIFGPVKSGICFCGKYQGVTINDDHLQFCEQCGVELTHSRVRRYRMGYIHLESPVTHVWYLKNRPSLIASLLNQPLQDIENLVYYDSFLAKPIINKPSLLKFLATQSKLYREPTDSFSHEPLPLFFFDDFWKYSFDRFFSSKWYHFIQQREMLTGAEVISKLLLELDLPMILLAESKKWQNLIRKENPNYEKQEQKQRILKRIILLRNLIQAKIKPEWTILINLPVLPPDLRPIVELKDGQLIRSDLTELYRLVLQRNQAISQLSLETPSIVSRMPKRLLQEAVDALLSNGAGGNIILDRNKKPYKSLSDIIKGKKGRFRENLLGKRVDYSGRSVIVVGPYLSLHQCGLPVEIATELFQPFLIRSLLVTKIARNPRAAKNIIQQKHTIIWKLLRTIVNKHVIILNRAPTLHRLGVQAFQPILVRERAIHLHPLVCTGFNADFDGDQMAIHVPLSLEAQAEAHLLMMPYFNLISTATGDAITLPSQDMLLGLYSITLGATIGIYNKTNRINSKVSEKVNKNKTFSFSNYTNVLSAHNQGILSIDSSVWLHLVNKMLLIINSIQDENPLEIQYRAKGENCNVYEHYQIKKNKFGLPFSKHIRTTVGRVILNQQIEQAIQGVHKSHTINSKKIRDKCE